MTTLIFDIETNGLIPEMDRLHCLCIKDVDTGQTWSFACPEKGMDVRLTDDGLGMLMEADVIVGHNVIKFDIPAIQKVYPWFKPKGVVRDTLVLARLISPEIAKTDIALVKQGKLPRNLTGRYSLEAFGHRLGEYKGDYKGGWEQWSPEMQSYCEQDIEVTSKLWSVLMDKKERLGFSDYSVELEHDVAAVIFRQEMNGIGFDTDKAHQLYIDLIGRRTELERELAAAFPPWDVKTPFIPKVNNKTRGYVKGQLTHKSKTIEFNPNSRLHIADRLKAKYQWEPKEFTEDGKAKVDETVLVAMPYPEAKLMAEYLMVQKRIGQLSEGAEAWLRNEKKGRIHGQVVTNGAVTGRMTHRKPNLAQVPSNHAPYGDRCRELFIPRKGWLLVGCDADALELRCLAHYMAAYDGGAYIDTVLKGDKKAGTDMHSVNCRALGLDPTKSYPVDGQMVTGRDIAKTWFYAFIYGAGDWKLGFTVGARGAEASVTKRGRKDRASFLANLPALGKLTELVQDKVMTAGSLKGIDGRRLSCRAKHSALNTLLQSAGAIAMKRALVILDNDLQAAGLIPGQHYEFVGNIHDEWQIEAHPDHADTVGTTAAAAIRKAGDELKFRCPLDGQYKKGNSWCDTH